MDVPQCGWRFAVLKGELHLVGEIGSAAFDEGVLQVPLRALEGLLNLDSQVLFLSLTLEVVLLHVRLAGVLGEIVLGRVFDLLHEIGDILLIGDNGYHFFLHLLVNVVKL